MKNIFALASLASLVLFFSACDLEGDGNLGSDAGIAGTAGAGAGGTSSLPSSTIGKNGNGTAVTYIGTFSSSSPILPATGTCAIPDIATGVTVLTSGGKTVSPLPSPMKYFVAPTNALLCTWGEASGKNATNNLDFTQDPLKGTTCQELVSDVPNAIRRISALAEGYGMASNVGECCELVYAPSGGGGYVQPSGVTCGDGFTTSTESGPPISGALCSFTGEFMGWACLFSP